MLVCAVSIASIAASLAQAACTAAVAGRVTPLHFAAATLEGAVSITFLGHV
jgi:hypothetical protein